MMTRGGSRAEGRQPDHTRPAADYTTGAIPHPQPIHRCTCGGAYSDHPDSHAAHKAVFGHRPIAAPQRQESP